MPEANNQIAIGLIGCGWIAEMAHLPSLRSLPNARLVAVADPVPERRMAAIQSLPEARSYEDAEGLLGDPEVTTVILALPPDLNAAIGTKALAAGKNLYLEKPLAATSADGLALRQAWRAAGTVMRVGYNFRLNPIVAAAKRTIDDGKLGDILSIQGAFSWTGPSTPGWRGDLGSGGGALLDLASHHIDLAHYLLDQSITMISAQTRTRRTPEDIVDLRLQTTRGQIVQLHASSSAGANANALTIFGSDGNLTVDLLAGRPEEPVNARSDLARVRRARRALAALHPARLMRSPGFEPSFALALDSFLEVCRGGHSPLPDPQAALTTLRIVEAARRSAAQNGAPMAIAAETRNEDAA